MLEIESTNEFYDLETYHKTKFRNVPDDYLKEYFVYPKCKDYIYLLHSAMLFYRTFGIKLNENERELLVKAVPQNGMYVFSNWFHFLLFNNSVLKKIMWH